MKKHLFLVKYNYREFFFFFLYFLLIFLLNTYYEYKNYQNFKISKHIFLKENIVLAHYTKENKNNKRYQVLKLKNRNFTFYTTSYKELNLKNNDSVSLRIINTNISFKNYLSKVFYAPSYDIKINKEYLKNKEKIIDFFINQHQNQKMKEFFGALFFAKNISNNLRMDVNFYGISHLIAISGFHLALIYGFVFLISKPIYGFFHKRFFPYRNLKYDISIFIFIILISYIYFIGLVPSYLRSLSMVLLGFYFLIKNIKILSFSFLLLALMLCISIFPHLLFNIGFFFSALGVFYIYLYLHHFKNKFHKITHIIFLNIWTFLAMVIPVLYFFPLISFQQFFSIPLSVLFGLFYPISLILHLLSYGDIFDFILISLFDIKFHSINLHISWWIFYIYLSLSFLSIFNKFLAIFVVSLGLIPFCFLF